MIFPYEAFDLSGLKTYPLKSRKRKVTVSDFARPSNRSTTIGDFIAALPDILAAADLKALVSAMATAKRSDSGLLWGLGAHVIKTGLGPVIVDLMRRGFVSGIATNGAAVIHDFEIALAGTTSEDVDEALGPGQFGMADETGRLLNGAINDGVAQGLGLGQSVASYLESSR